MSGFLLSETNSLKHNPGKNSHRISVLRQTLETSQLPESVLLINNYPEVLTISNDSSQVSQEDEKWSFDVGYGGKTFL